MKRYYRKNRSSVALFLVSNLLAAGSSVFMSFLLGTFADSAMEGDLSRVWKIALVTLFYLCIETFFAFLLDYSRDIVVQRVGRGLAAVEKLRVDVERAELAGRIPERLTFGADAHGVGFKQPRYDRVIHGLASLAVFVFCYYKGWSAKREERREICADKKWTQGCAA